MLTGAEILRRVESGEIQISDFDVSRLNPNSYNLRIDKKLRLYDFTNTKYLQTTKRNQTYTIEIPESGLILSPNTLYLGSTVEHCYGGKNLVPCISGRSSVARLGIEIHRTAGFGDVGFNGTWTLEITVVHPVIIYPYQEICQVYFEEVTGDTSIQYHGRYQYQEGATPSRMYLPKFGTLETCQFSVDLNKDDTTLE